MNSIYQSVALVSLLGIGWLRRSVSDSGSFNEARDCVVRVYHMEDVGRIAIATFPDFSETYRIVLGETQLEVVSTLIESLNNSFRGRSPVALLELPSECLERHRRYSAILHYTPGRAHEERRAIREWREAVRRNGGSRVGVPPVESFIQPNPPLIHIDGVQLSWNASLSYPEPPVDFVVET